MRFSVSMEIFSFYNCGQSKNKEKTFNFNLVYKNICVVSFVPSPSFNHHYAIPGRIKSHFIRPGIFTVN